MPGILIGCALGHIYGEFVHSKIFNVLTVESHVTFAIVAATAFLSGYTRLTYSLAVVMMETTESLNLFLIIIGALFVSYGVGGFFNKSLYVGMLRSKNIPMLQKRILSRNKHITA